MITAERLRRFAPNARADLTAALLVGEPELNVAGIVGNRLHHFLSRVAVETGGLHSIEENLNYSAEGLAKTFSRARISLAQCQQHGRAPGRPANAVQPGGHDPARGPRLTWNGSSPGSP